MQSSALKEYDGFYFLPHYDGDDEGLRFDFFRFMDEYANGVKKDHSEMGDMYHIVFIKQNDEGDPVLDENFDAIFVDPVEYVNNLLGADLFGCVVRKTDKSEEWLEKYLTRIKDSDTLRNIKTQIESIADN
jgi:hypothetical protein